jgi:hypothetical protein
MKTSNKILFITGAVIVVMLFAVVTGSRIILNKFTNSYESGEINYTNFETEYKEITNFTSLDVKGDWNVTISRGDSYSITVRANKSSEDPYEIKKEGHTLLLKENQNINFNKKLTVDITLPEIHEIYSEGGLKLELTGFTGPQLILNFNGGTWVDGSNCKFENLLLTSAGAINLEFEDIITVNVDAQLSGAGNLLFNMDGGILSGNAAGAVNIEYYGTARQEILAAGLVNISQRD